MLIKRWIALLGTLYLAPDDGAGGGEPAPAAPDAGAPAGGEPAPAAPAEPAVPRGTEPEPTLPSAEQIRDRILAGQDPDALAPDGMPYRDAKELREGLTAVRQELGPIAKQLGALPEAQREAVLAFAPAQAAAIGNPQAAADVATVFAFYPQLEGDDRAAVDAALADVALDPGGTIEWLGQAAEVLRSMATGEPAPGGDGTGAPEVDAFGYALDDPERPLTQAEVDARVEERMAAVLQGAAQSQAEAQALADTTAEILADAEKLGYDPHAEAGSAEHGLFQMFVDAWSANPNGTAEQAHEKVAEFQQKIIDSYVQGKIRTDRPNLPGSGAPATGGHEPETLEEMSAASLERLRASR